MMAFLKPVVVTEARPDTSEPEERLYLRSYLFMRAMAGAIGVAPPRFGQTARGRAEIGSTKPRTGMGAPDPRQPCTSHASAASGEH